MPLIVEDGTGKADADAYASLATINAYATAHGLPFVITGGTNEADAEAAARRAFTWLNGSFRSSFTGRRTHGRSQAGEWPRSNAHDNQCPPEYIANDVIPQEIIDAQCEAAIREKASPGSLSPDVTPGKIKQAVRVGQVAVEYAIGSGTAREQRPVIAVINDILGPLLGGSGSPLSGETVHT